MTYDEALSFWYSRVDYERKAALPGELKLDRMAKLLERLGNPHLRLKIVHIAGSKGKGSTAAMFAAVARAAGLRCGLFTSPHLVDVRERIQVDGAPISRDELAELLNEIRSGVDELTRDGDTPTFFEIGTALGFLHFARNQVDLAVVEVGLGGRFDSTNVCQPILGIITSISYEHTDILGKKLSQIAFEKSGIIKPGCPVVSGVATPEAADVIRQIASERHCRLIEIGTDFQLDHRPGRVTLEGACSPSVVSVKMGCVAPMTCNVALLGQHQSANASLVIVGSRLLREQFPMLDDLAVAKGLAEVQWPARMEVFPSRPMVVLDCAHNAASAQALIDTLAASFPRAHRTLIFACSADKDFGGMLSVFQGEFDRIIFTEYQLNPRALSVKELGDALHQINPAGKFATAVDPRQALTMARALETSLIVIAGSVFLAGETRPLLAGACEDSEKNAVIHAHDSTERSES